MNWTINPYRGCRHACVYCFARPTHTYYGLNAGADFHTQIFVKINAPQVLRAELARPGWKFEPVCLGSATDPYQPAERRYRLSRQILSVLCEYANPLEIITKSPLLLDDLDLLTELNRRTGGKVAINMSVTTLDESISRLIDPGAPSPHKRLDAVARLSAAGIRARVFIMPLLPGITDDPQALAEVVKAAADAGASSVHADSLRIARGLEDYYMGFVRKNFPEALPRYERIYRHGRSTMPADRYKQALRQKMDELRALYQWQEPANRAYEQPARLEAALEAAENVRPNRNPKRPQISHQLPPERERQAQFVLDS